MKTLISILLFTFSVTAWSVSECRMQDGMSWEQWYNVSKAYYVGNEHDFGLTMAAIVIKESSAGVSKINKKTHDYGLTQINIYTAMTRTGTVDEGMNKEKLAIELVENDDLALDLALEELLYWNEYYDSNWPMVVKSYNAGFNPEAAKGYYEDVSNLVTQLRQCFQTEYVSIQE